jgi:hypothetical protein
VKRSPSALGLIMVLCAMNLLLVQLMGLHFHRHMMAGAADLRTSLHLRDAGMHLHENADDHHATEDRASHPGDLEIDPLGAGLAKFSKVWLSPQFLLAVILCVMVLTLSVPSGFAPLVRRHPALFFLRPPSHAPPLKPSPV